ncbi:MAG: c-type cytochrome [Magnetovibrionaceae bacterium]
MPLRISFQQKVSLVASKGLCLIAGVGLALGLAFGATSASADGAKLFKKCGACHTADGGSKKKAGPDLQGIMSRTIGQVEHKYTDGFKAIAAKGMPWDAALMDEYLTDPTAFVQKHSGDAGAKSKMLFKVKKAEDRAALIEYLNGL